MGLKAWNISLLYFITHSTDSELSPGSHQGYKSLVSNQLNSCTEYLNNLSFNVKSSKEAKIHLWNEDFACELSQLQLFPFVFSFHNFSHIEQLFWLTT